MAENAKAVTGRKASKGSPGRRAPGRAAGMSIEHKQALATGRDEGRAVRRYLEALEAHKPKRGRKRSADSISKRITAIDAQLGTADPLARVHLVQERLELADQLRSIDAGDDLVGYEDAFVEVARSYSARKGLSYAAWREVGIDPSVLKRAGIARTRQ